MKWFKHMTCSFNDERLSAIVDMLGMEGYGFWWRILEIVAEKLDESGDYSCSFSAKKWGNFFGFSAKKFEKFVRIFQKFELFEVEFFENAITVSIPKLLKYRDEYSKKKGRNSGQTPEKLRRKEEEKEEEYINTPPTPSQRGGCGVESTSAHGETLTPREPGTNPQAQGTNPRMTGENPRALGTNPRSTGDNPRAEETPRASRAGKNSVADLAAVAAEYTQNPELRATLEDFRTMRERLRKPLTAKAFSLTCGELDKLAGEDEAMKIAILNQSIQRGWQGVFPLRDEAKPKANQWAGAI